MSLRKYEKMKEEIAKKEEVEKELKKLKETIDNIIVRSEYVEGFEYDTGIFYVSKDKLMDLLNMKRDVHNPKTWQKIVPQFEITERG